MWLPGHIDLDLPLSAQRTPLHGRHQDQDKPPRHGRSTPPTRAAIPPPESGDDTSLTTSHLKLYVWLVCLYIIYNI